MSHLTQTALTVCLISSLLYLFRKWVSARQIANQLGSPGKSILLHFPFSGVATVLGPWFPPKGVLGNYYALFTLYAKYGSTCLSSVYLWSSSPVFWLADADAIKTVFTARATFPKDTDSSMIQSLDVYGPNVFTTEGDAWKRHRNVSKPAFNEANNEYVWRETIRIMDTWFKVVDDSNEADPERTVDLVKALNEITLAVICSAGFGQRIPTFASQPEEDVSDSGVLPFGKAVASAVQLLLHKVLIPTWMYTFSERFPIPMVSPALREIKDSFDAVQRHLMDLTSESRAWVTGGKKSTRLEAALLRNLVEANMDLDGEDIAEKRQLTDRELLSTVFIFLTAGHETSSHVLAFAIALLAIYPEVQSRVLEEVLRIWPDEETATQETYRDSMSSLTYTNAVFNETMRFFAPAPRLEKVVATDTTLKARRFKIDAECTKPSDIEEYVLPVPKGSYVIIDTYALHMNPIYWGEDVHKFNPDRFIDTETYRWPRDAFIAFAGGQRRCVGEKFAITESVCILAHLVRKYEILVPGKLRSKSFEEQKQSLLAWRAWITPEPLNAKVVLRRRQH